MAGRTFVFCTRLYNMGEQVTDFWRRLAGEVARISGIGLRFEIFPFPHDIMDVWGRPDLGCTFICGRPFALGGMRHKPIAVPLRVHPSGSASRYHTKLLVRADSGFQTLEDTFGGRLGLTVHHSLSGYLAVKRHLAMFAPPSGKPVYAEEVGDLHISANSLKALAENRVDVVPLDGYCHELLERHAPEKLAHTRVIAETRDYPMPFMAASPTVSDADCDALRQGLFAAAALPAMRPVLTGLGLAGFAVPDIAEYAGLAEDLDSV